MAANSNKTDYMPLILVGGILLVANNIFGKSAEERAGEKITDKLESLPVNKNPFLYATYKLAPKKGYFRFTITTKEATKAASLISAGIGTMTDDESKIVSGIKMARTKADIAFISMMFDKVYVGHDLYTILKQNLSKGTELGNLINAYVMKLPEYSTTGTKS